MQQKIAKQKLKTRDSAAGATEQLILSFGIKILVANKLQNSKSGCGSGRTLNLGIEEVMVSSKI